MLKKYLCFRRLKASLLINQHISFKNSIINVYYIYPKKTLLPQYRFL